MNPGDVNILPFLKVTLTCPHPTPLKAQEVPKAASRPTPTTLSLLVKHHPSQKHATEQVWFPAPEVICPTHTHPGALAAGSVGWPPPVLLSSEPSQCPRSLPLGLHFFPSWLLNISVETASTSCLRNKNRSPALCSLLLCLYFCPFVAPTLACPTHIHIGEPCRKTGTGGKEGASHSLTCPLLLSPLPTIPPPRKPSDYIKSK